MKARFLILAIIVAFLTVNIGCKKEGCTDPFATN